jgi:hypothetical protein
VLGQAPGGVAKNMIAVRIGPPMRMAVVGSPDYLARRRASRKLVRRLRLRASFARSLRA